MGYTTDIYQEHPFDAMAKEIASLLKSKGLNDEIALFFYGDGYWFAVVCNRFQSINIGESGVIFEATGITSSECLANLRSKIMEKEN